MARRYGAEVVWVVRPILIWLHSQGAAVSPSIYRGGDLSPSRSSRADPDRDDVGVVEMLVLDRQGVGL